MHIRLSQLLADQTCEHHHHHYSHHRHSHHHAGGDGEATVTRYVTNTDAASHRAFCDVVYLLEGVLYTHGLQNVFTVAFWCASSQLKLCTVVQLAVYFDANVGAVDLFLMFFALIRGVLTASCVWTTLIALE